MNSLLLCLSVLGLLTLALGKSEDYSYTHGFRKRYTDSKEFMLPYCPPLPEEDDGKPKEAIDPICLEEDRRRSLKKIADLGAEILSLKKEILCLKKEVNEEKNRTEILIKENLEINQKVNEEKNSTEILKKENLELNQRIQELFAPLDKDGTRNIFDASEKGSLKGLNYWYSKEPSSIHAKNGQNYNWTPLHYASDNGHLPIIEFLLSKGVDLEAEESNYNGTPLMRASLYGHVPVVQALLDKGANINHQNKYKYTPLHYAVNNDKLPVVQILIERGADRGLKNKKIQTPLDLAKEYGRKSIVDYLSSL